jgi:hypothetical protein
MNFKTFEKCLILLLFIKIIYGSEFCSTDNCDEMKQQKDINLKQQIDKRTERQINIDCNKLVMRMRKKEQLKLTGFDDEESEALRSEKNKMFFVESSGRSYLTARQACAIESAIRNSGLNVFVVAMTSKGNIVNVIWNLCIDLCVFGGKRKSDKETERQRHRETDRQTERQTDRQRDRQTERQRDRQTERQTDRETERQRDRETERQKDRETERQRDRERQRDKDTDRQRDRQKDKATER